jgi:hypothetical protein
MKRAMAFARPHGLALAMVLVTGCSSYSIRTTTAMDIALDRLPSPGEALVCAVRPHVNGALVPVVFHDNGKLVGGTKGPSYFCWRAEPGEHRITAQGGDDIDRELGTTNDDTATLWAEPGRRYFLHESTANVLGLSSLQWVDEAKGRSMIADGSWADMDATPSSEQPPGRLPLAPAASPSAPSKSEPVASP